MSGFDFPIGLPRRYAEKTGFADFKDALRNVGRGRWADFYRPATRADEISLTRPFYPQRPGGTRRSHLVAGHDSEDFGEFYRRCELSSGRNDRTGCPLFWTLGGNQVGRAAIAGWQEVIAPALDSVAIWPFDGPLATLIERHQTVVVETYPAVGYALFGFPAFSKTRQARGSGGGALGPGDVAPYLLAAMERCRMRPSAGCEGAIETGFDASHGTDDGFDAVVGLVKLVWGIERLFDDAIPDDPAVRSFEGWIYGRSFAVSAT